MTSKRMRPWREGVATRTDGPGWAWVVGCAGLGTGGDVAARFDESALWLALGLAIAGAAGVAWQVLYRRDLADRLFWLSVLLVVATLLWGTLPAIPGAGEPSHKDLAGLLSFPGLIAGLVLTEQWLRRRDRRTE
jgi:drug/metabolite transporter (DMT)-like permease